MVRYVGMVLQTAKFVGNVKEIEMKETGIYLPARIEITGETEDGEKFKLELTVGEKKNADS
ncbi:MAG: hypothetical protein IJZ56_03265 [Oscillospiraceae bacterium]|nr:hypothetical protein [Oscillospiraceae bacterium]